MISTATRVTMRALIYSRKKTITNGSEFLPKHDLNLVCSKPARSPIPDGTAT